MYVLFLVRDPHPAIISRYYLRKDTFLPQQFIDTVGFEVLYDSFKYVKQYGYNKPYILQAEAIASNPELIIKKITFSSIMLNQETFHFKGFDI